MSSQPFSFPPPPPPPQVPQSYPAYHATQQAHRGYGNRNASNGRGGWRRGRGYTQGPPKGGNFMSSNSMQGRESYPVVENRQNVGHGAFEAEQRHNGHQPPNYPAVQVPQYPYIFDLRQDYGHRVAEPPIEQLHPHQSHVHNASSSYGYPIHGSQSTDWNLQGPPTRTDFDNNGWPLQHQSFPQPQASNPPFVRPPPNGIISAHQQNPFPNIQNGFHKPSKSFPSHRGRGNKRGHGDAFGTPRHQNPRSQVAPAVPSFGGALPLPAKPPAPQDHGKRPRKKKRKHNQLGLTPKTEEHESSEEEEDDVDEEAKLAAAAASSGPGSQLLQFEFKGHTSTLSSAAEIAAWIAERKKRFPTKARAAEAAERKRQRDEAQKAAVQARREAQEKQKAEAREKQRIKTEAEQKGRKSKEDAEDAAARSRRKVEKLRRQMEKEEKRAKKAEAKALKPETNGNGENVKLTQSKEIKKRKRSDSGETMEMKIEEPRPVIPEVPDQPDLGSAAIKAESNGVQTENETSTANLHEANFHPVSEESQGAKDSNLDPLTPTSQPRPMDDDIDFKIDGENTKVEAEVPPLSAEKVNGALAKAGQTSVAENSHTSSLSDSDTSSDVSSTDSEDLTSSSGSSDVSSSSDEVPEKLSSKRRMPERVAPPKRERRARICKAFLKGGRCKWGDRCRNRHELSERGGCTAVIREDRKPFGRGERIGLYQRLVEQEKRKENEQKLAATIEFGEKGLLEPGSGLSNRLAEGEQ